MAAELRLVREPFADVVRIDGALAADAGERTFRIAVRDPSRFAADALRTALRREGIRVTGPAGTADEQPAPLPRGRFVELSRWVSEPLRKVAVPTLKDSQNLYAEQLFRTAARVAGGPSDSAGAAGHAAQVLRSLGVDTTGIYLADGSGLSRRNLVRPRQLAELLAALWRGPHRAVVFDALPVAGQDGTLQNRFATGPARGRVRAKTGFIARVVGLSGYVPRPDPGAAPLAFAVLLNNFTGSDAEAKAAADAFVTELARSVGLPEPAATGPRPADGRRVRRNRRRGGERCVRLDEAPRGGVRRLRS
jgi:D-alanyl-D-alanine carboxypeptidase/D-alanyl-D-alanine-endopeptidase (penicillin-binding protein 4)